MYNFSPPSQSTYFSDYALKIKTLILKFGLVSGMPLALSYNAGSGFIGFLNKPFS